MNLKSLFYKSFFALLLVILVSSSFTAKADSVNTNGAIIEPVKTVLGFYSTLPGQVMQSYAALGNGVLNAYQKTGETIWNGTNSVAGKIGGEDQSASVISSVGSFLCRVFNLCPSASSTSTVSISPHLITPSNSQNNNSNNSSTTVTTTSSNNNPVSNSNSNFNSSDHVIQNPVSVNGVTESELNSRLGNLQNFLLNIINHPSATSGQTVNNYITYPSGGYVGTISGPSNSDIDNLQNQITNVINNGGGNPFDQSLNTTDSPTFNNVTATAFYGDGSHLTGITGGTSSSSIRGLFSAGSGLSYDQASGIFSNIGVTSLLGTANQVTVSNATGTVTLSLPQNIGTASSPTFAGLTLTGLSGVLKASGGVIAGGATTSDLPEGTNLYFTNARADSRFATDLAATTTNALPEGSNNLYYTNARVDSRFATDLAATTTDALTEGATNKYYTDARARAAISSSATGLSYNNGTGVFALTSGYTIPLTASTTEWAAAAASTTALTPSYIRGLISNSATGLSYNNSTGVTSLTSGYNIPLTASTTNWENFYETPSSRITAGTGLSWSGNTLNNTGVTSIGGLTGSVATSSLGLLTTNVAEGSNLYFTNARADSRFSADIAATTTNALPEGSNNLYYTNARVDTEQLAGKPGIFSNSTSTNFFANNANATNFLGTNSTSSNLAAANFIINGSNFNNLLGTGLQNSAGALAVSLSPFSTTNLSEGSNLYYTDARARAAISSSATGLSYNNGTGVFSLTSGYTIPLTASTTNWNNFYNTPSTRITAGTGLSWSGNTLNASGGGGSPADSTGAVQFNAGGSFGGDASTFYWDNTAKTLSVGTQSALGTFTVQGQGNGTSIFINGHKPSEDESTGPARLFINGTLGNGCGGCSYPDFSTWGVVFGSGAGVSANIGMDLRGGLNIADDSNNINIGDPNNTGIQVLDTDADHNDDIISINSVNDIDLNATGTVNIDGVASFGSAVYFNSSAGNAGNILQSTGSGGSPIWVATTSLGLLTTNVAEGSNLYYTDARARAAISSSATGLSYNNGTGVFALTSGYTIPLTASTTEWAAAAASTTALTPSYIRGLISNSATGLSYNNSTGVTSLTSGYNIPLTASTTNWENFYETPSSRITAGTGLSWSGNTLNNTGVTSIGGLTGSVATSSLGLQPTGNYITALTGDVTASGPGSAAATLATVNSNVGTFRSVTVNGKGLVTAATNPTTFAGYGISDSSADLRAALTDNTGTGVAVFGTSPTFTTNILVPTIKGTANNTNGAIDVNNRGLLSSSGASVLQWGTSELDLSNDTVLAWNTGDMLDSGQNESINWFNRTLYNNGGSGILYYGGNTGVGIGSSTPFAKLAIQGSGTGTGLTFQTTDSSNVPKFTILDNGNVGVGTSSPIASLAIKGSASTNPFVVASSTGAQLLTVLANGNLGIGTSTPNFKLSVAGTSNFTSALNFNGSAGTAGFVLQSLGSGAAPTWVATSSLGFTGGGASAPGSIGDLQFTDGAGNFQADDAINWDGSSLNIDSRHHNIPGIGHNSTPLIFLDATQNDGGVGVSILQPDESRPAVQTQDAENSNGNFFNIYQDDSGNAVLSNSGNDDFSIDTSGGLYAPNLATAAGGNYALCWDSSTGQITENNGGTSCTVSSERFKHDIATSTSGLAEVMALRPVSFVLNNDPTNAQQLGFVAEEAAQVDPRLVFYNKQGQIQGFQYEEFTSVLAKAIQELDATTTSALAALNVRVSNLEELNASLSASSTSPTIGSDLLSTLQSFGTEMLNGVAYVSHLFTKQLTVGAPTHPNGITLYDQVTGAPYCLVIRNGQTVTNPGECQDVTASSSQTTIIQSGGNDGGGADATSSSPGDGGNASSTPPSSGGDASSTPPNDNGGGGDTTPPVVTPPTPVPPMPDNNPPALTGDNSGSGNDGGGSGGAAPADGGTSTPAPTPTPPSDSSSS